MDEGLFTDYQLEKFSGSAEARNRKREINKEHEDSLEENL
jgi:hypothetical protein